METNEDHEASIRTMAERVQQAKAEIQERIAKKKAADVANGRDNTSIKTFAVPKVKLNNPVQIGGGPTTLRWDETTRLNVPKNQVTTVFTPQEPTPSQKPQLIQASIPTAPAETSTLNQTESETSTKEPQEQTTSTARNNPPLALETSSGKRDCDQSVQHSPVTASSFNNTGIAEPMSAVSLASIGPIRKKQRPSIASSHQCPGSHSMIGSESPSMASTIASPTPQTDSLPDWYINASKSNRHIPGERQIWDRLKEISKLINRCKERRSKPADLEAAFKDVKAELDHLTFLDVTAFGLKRANLLDNQLGLPQLFDSEYSDGMNYPWFIKTDARILYNNWKIHKNFDGSNMFRGIKNMVKAKDVKNSGPAIDGEFKIDWHYFGERYLGNGQWFAMQLCAVRDGAHGSAQGGIAGVRDKGATSIVMSGTIYEKHDRDEGDQIWYSGTPQQKKGESEPTVGTQFLMNNEKTGLLVRVLRSQHLPKTNKYKPQRGIRYDGLYKVVDHTLIDGEKHHYVFHLIREPGQDPIRYQGPEVKPTRREIEVYDAEMSKYGRKKDKL